jgi:phosphoribosylanthranilate isomerase
MTSATDSRMPVEPQRRATSPPSQGGAAFRIKICGITTVDDATLVARAGADAVGLNFYPKSARFLAPEQAEVVVRAVPAGVVKVGLFVNATAVDVCAMFDRLELDLVQLHGDEPPEFLVDLGDRPVMRAFRVGSDGLRPVEDYLSRCRQLGVMPHMVLVDAQVAGAYGGTGQVANWAALKHYSSANPPLVLAGGLAPANVAEAIRAVQPMAVDTASGVESSPGRKDPALVERFIEAARAAFSPSR